MLSAETGKGRFLMESRTYYYARVSSKEQHLDRQIAAFAALGAQEREIITDKESVVRIWTEAAIQPLKRHCYAVAIHWL